MKKHEIEANRLVWARYTMDGIWKSSVDKFYPEDTIKTWLEKCGANPGDLLLILAGSADKTRKALGELRLLIGDQLGFRDKNTFSVIWVVDFPLLEWSEETGRYLAMHHPFTSPKREDLPILDTDPGKVRANAYDLVINGTEIGGGSLRIHDRPTQERVFKHLGLTEEEVQKQFGFLLEAFEYGAPPHGGIALGFDRLCALFAGADSIRDVIAFPKNNSGRDTMTDSPSTISVDQLAELGYFIASKELTRSNVWIDKEKILLNESSMIFISYLTVSWNFIFLSYLNVFIYIHSLIDLDLSSAL